VSREVLRRASLIGYEPFRCWGHLVRATVAQRRGVIEAALAEGRLALDSARQVDLAHYIAFAQVQLGRVIAVDGDARAAESVLREGLATAVTAGADWFASLARIRLAELLGRQGDAAAAATLRDQVLAEGSGSPVRQGREYFFLALGGDPQTIAQEQLAVNAARSS
jgi:ATP/maltotriose-dependent transcriptional regulator MalT